MSRDRWFLASKRKDALGPRAELYSGSGPHRNKRTAFARVP